MKRKYRIKKSAKNQFSALSGIEAIQLSGSADCLVVNRKTIHNIPPAKYAYCLYKGILKPSPYLKVKQSCGIKQCVKQEHLCATFSPPEDILNQIKTNSWMGVESLADTYQVGPELIADLI